MSISKIQATKNYRLFVRHHDENRPLTPEKRQRLKDSMKKYGFLKCYPIICFRDSDGKLIVKDGQHRLAIAEELGITVHWVLADTDFDVALVNATVKGWSKRDYAMKYAANGVKAYEEILDLHERHAISVTMAAQLLGGTATFQNISKSFHSGTFKIKDRKWAEAVASLYAQLGNISRQLKDGHFLSSLMACCRVKDFDSDRLLNGAQKCREKLVKYGSREGYMDMLEQIYNFNRSKLFGLKIAALMEMRSRNPARKKDKQEAAA